ncbi:MAG: hypothetical protein ABIH83_02955, partial [Candidatus Micrarchaeota archaeon]
MGKSKKGGSKNHTRSRAKKGIFGNAVMYVLSDIRKKEDELRDIHMERIPSEIKLGELIPREEKETHEIEYRPLPKKAKKPEPKQEEAWLLLSSGVKKDSHAVYVQKPSLKKMPKLEKFSSDDSIFAPRPKNVYNGISIIQKKQKPSKKQKQAGFMPSLFAPMKKQKPSKKQKHTEFLPSLFGEMKKHKKAKKQEPAEFMPSLFAPAKKHKKSKKQKHAEFMPSLFGEMKKHKKAKKQKPIELIPPLFAPMKKKKASKKHDEFIPSLFGEMKKHKKAKKPEIHIPEKAEEPPPPKPKYVSMPPVHAQGGGFLLIKKRPFVQTLTLPILKTEVPKPTITHAPKPEEVKEPEYEPEEPIFKPVSKQMQQNTSYQISKGIFSPSPHSSTSYFTQIIRKKKKPLLPSLPVQKKAPAELKTPVGFSLPEVKNYAIDTGMFSSKPSASSKHFDIIQKKKIKRSPPKPVYPPVSKQMQQNTSYQISKGIFSPSPHSSTSYFTQIIR